MKNPMFRSSYCEGGIRNDSRKTIVDFLVTILRNVKFDVIACRGVSGLAVAPIVSHILNKPLIIIRKQGDGSHSGSSYEGCYNFKSYIVIDDFISTGGTIMEIRKVVKTFNPQAEFIGVFTYEPKHSHCHKFAGMPEFCCTLESYDFGWNSVGITKTTLQCIYDMCKKRKLKNIPIGEWPSEALKMVLDSVAKSPLTIA